jgi:hypothetical protein
MGKTNLAKINIYPRLKPRATDTFGEATLSQRVSISLKILIKFGKWSALSGGGSGTKFPVHFHLARAQGFIDFANSSDRRNCFGGTRFHQTYTLFVCAKQKCLPLKPRTALFVLVME